MSQFHVLLTDYAWEDLSIEQAILDEVDAEIVVAPAREPADLARVAREHAVDAIMTNWVNVPEPVIAASPACRIVSRLGIGLDNIDVAACTARGIPVTNVPTYCLTEVAEHALALMLALGRNIGVYHLATKQGRYELQEGPALRRLAGQTLGIVGLGNIGRELARKAQALGFEVLATSRRLTGLVDGVRIVSLNDLLAASDYVSLHVPVTSETHHMIGAQQLALMKPTAMLINTARGGLIDHQALAAALEAGRLAGAGLDVQEPEPPDVSQAPYNDPRVIVTPHAAFVSAEALQTLRSTAARQVADRLAGRTPEHVVNQVEL